MEVLTKDISLINSNKNNYKEFDKIEIFFLIITNNSHIKFKNQLNGVKLEYSEAFNCLLV